MAVASTNGLLPLLCYTACSLHKQNYSQRKFVPASAAKSVSATHYE